MNAFKNKFALSPSVVSPPTINTNNTNSQGAIAIRSPIAPLPIVPTPPPSLPIIPSAHVLPANNFIESSPSTSSSDTIVMEKGDSAASHHYWRKEDTDILSNIKDSIGPSVLLLNDDKILSTQLGFLPLSPSLSVRATTAMIFPSLKSVSLISIGQLCDDNCEVFF